MTDRIYAYTVILSETIRDDDAESITNAIKMINGVVGVTPLVADSATYWAIENARNELREKMASTLYPGII
jgi:hypothetical protein